MVDGGERGRGERHALAARQTGRKQGKIYRPKSPDIFDISFLSVGADKKISIFFIQILFKFT